MYDLQQKWVRGHISEPVLPAYSPVQGVVNDAHGPAGITCSAVSRFFGCTEKYKPAVEVGDRMCSQQRSRDVQ